MRFHVLGASGTFPAAGRPSSGFLVGHRETRLWIDCGPGTFSALTARMSPSLVDGVIVSHTHIDHCSDLFAFYHYLAFGPEPRTGVPLYMPPGASEHFSAFIRADDAGHDFHNVFDHKTMGDGEVATIGEITLTFAEADHSVPTNAVRIQADGKSIAYSGDTGPAGGYEALAKDATLALCEATYQGERDPEAYPHHLTAGEAGALARRSGVKRLMLTHIPPTLDPQVSLDEAEKAFGRTVELAVPGMEITI